MFAFIFLLQYAGDEDSAQAENSEDNHGNGIVISDNSSSGIVLRRETVDDKADECRHHRQADVLDIEDNGVCRAELFHRDNLRNRGPQGTGHQ